MATQEQFHGYLIQKRRLWALQSGSNAQTEAQRAAYFIVQSRKEGVAADLRKDARRLGTEACAFVQNKTDTEIEGIVVGILGDLSWDGYLSPANTILVSAIRLACQKGVPKGTIGLGTVLAVGTVAGVAAVGIYKALTKGKKRGRKKR